VIPEGYLKPEGDLAITENGSHDVTEFATVNVEVPIPEGYLVPEGEMTVTENGDHDVTEYAGIKVAVPIPEGYLVPEGVLTVTENGTHDVTEYASVDVDVAGMDADPWDQAFEVTGEPQEGNPLTEFLKGRNGSYLFYVGTGTTSGSTYNNMTEAPYIDTSSMTRLDWMFSYCRKLSFVPLYDTRNVTTMSGMFNECSVLTTVPALDTSNVTDMSQMLGFCGKLTSVPLFDTRNVTDMRRMFYGCTTLSSVPMFDTSKVTDMGSMFDSCTALTTVPALDMRNVVSASSMFPSSKAVTEIWVKNIKTTLQVYGCTLLTLDSLVHLIYELRQQSSSRTLTMGAANLEKLANVYVKLIDITDDMRAEDDLIDQKLPFVVCESTDEGAQLITTYVSAKNWSLK
jgi:surface protein